MNKRQLAKILRESADAPTKGELAIILESGDRRYWVQRAIEYCKLALVDEGKLHLNDGCRVIKTGSDYLKTAITLLAAARIQDDK
jgi:hypothetical protein